MEITSSVTLVFKLRTKEAIVVLEPDKVTLTSSKRDQPFVITSPGEYEVLDISIFAYKSTASLIFLIGADGLNLVYVGGQTGKLPEEVFDQIGDIAVLFVPTVDSAAIAQAEPRYVILTQANSSFTPLDKLVVQAGKLPEEREVLLLHGRD